MRTFNGQNLTKYKDHFAASRIFMGQQMEVEHAANVPPPPARPTPLPSTPPSPSTPATPSTQASAPPQAHASAPQMNCAYCFYV